MDKYEKRGDIIYCNGQPYARIDDDEVYRINPPGFLGNYDSSSRIWTHVLGEETLL